MNSSTRLESPSKTRLSGWLVTLAVVWLALGARVVVAWMRHESLAGDLALPAFAFFACSALIASQIYARLTKRS